MKSTYRLSAWIKTQAEADHLAAMIQQGSRNFSAQAVPVFHRWDIEITIDPDIAEAMTTFYGEDEQ